MKPEYWKDALDGWHYKILSKRRETLKILEVTNNSIAIADYGINWVYSNASPCSPYAFMKRYKQTLKKIERAVAK
jgi:hypothetical protein